MRHILRKTSIFGAVLLFGLTACADLEVVNPNAPGAEQALANPSDIVTLIQGSYRQWWLSVHDPSGPAHVYSNMSFQQSSWPANFGMVDYSRLPRREIVNVGLHQFYGNVVNGVWFRNYRALSSVAQGLRSLQDEEIAGALSADELQRARAFGKFMQGLGHGSLALFYEAGFILDEDNVDGTRDASGAPIQQTAVPYTDLLDAALGYFDDAILLSQGQTFTIPSSWMSVEVSAADLAALASTMKARYRANVARNPAQRQDVSQGGIVDWQAVIDEIEAGLPSWNMSYGYFASPFWNDILPRQGFSWIGWGQSSYMIYGMADQSGNYQEWLSVTPAETRHPILPSGDPFLIVTPDQRFAQGTTAEEQQAGQDLSTIIQFNGGPLGLPGNNWGQPARGTQRWSFYRNSVGDGHIFFGQTSIPEVTVHETRLLTAEGLYRLGDAPGAAALINVTRVGVGGLSEADPTEPNDGNDSCVPRLPDESCGDLLEMLKWEKRMHTAFLGVHANTWYFDGRGWGDLYAGTPEQLPIPCDENDLWGLPCNNVGGVGGESAAPVSVYAWPDEG